MAYRVNVVSEARATDDFRRVLFTGQRSQLVVMTIPPGGEIGEERHDHVEQTLFCLSGNGTAILDGARSPFAPGDAVVVTPGTRHNFLNTGADPLRIYTIYAPANHIDGRVHHTRADAAADEADEEFGHRAGG
jgi:mannose-6-phosphate isomerase-like protein (cupin superfamily)